MIKKFNQAFIEWLHIPVPAISNYYWSNKFNERAVKAGYYGKKYQFIDETSKGFNITFAGYSRNPEITTWFKRRGYKVKDYGIHQHVKKVDKDTTLLFKMTFGGM